MALSSSQRTAIKADILATPALNTMFTEGNLGGLVDAYNAAASPAFTVWKTSVPIAVVGQTFNGAEWAGMTSANHTRLQTVAQYCGTVNPSLSGIRAMFDDIWSGAGGANTRAALLALWKRTATRAEKLFATGTGSDAVPATMTFEGAVSYTDFIGL